MISIDLKWKFQLNQNDFRWEWMCFKLLFDFNNNEILSHLSCARTRIHIVLYVLDETINMLHIMYWHMVVSCNQAQKSRKENGWRKWRCPNEKENSIEEK